MEVVESNKHVLSMYSSVLLLIVGVRERKPKQHRVLIQVPNLGGCSWPLSQPSVARWVKNVPGWDWGDCTLGPAQRMGCGLGPSPEIYLSIYLSIYRYIELYLYLYIYNTIYMYNFNFLNDYTKVKRNNVLSSN